MAVHLSTSVAALPGIGATSAKDLHELDIRTVRDLLWYFPFRYDDFSVVKPIGSLRHDETVTVHGKIRTIDSREAKSRRMILVEAIVEDETGSVKVTWFNQAYLLKTLRSGMEISLAGRVDNRFGCTLVNPVWEPAGSNVHTGRLVPVYGLTGSLTPRRLRQAMQASLGAVKECVEWIPETVRTDGNFPGLSEAVSSVHFPSSKGELDRAVDRLKFDELFLHQLMFADVRRERTIRSAHVIPLDIVFLKSFTASLPFVLTDAQRRAAWEVVQDTEKPHPMNRLLQGDVGSGKTAVAAMAIAHAMHRGMQTAYLAPTEILAMQQQTALVRLFQRQVLEKIGTVSVSGVGNSLNIVEKVDDLPTPGVGKLIGLLTAGHVRLGDKDVTRSELFVAMKEGNVACLVGTHALLEDRAQLDGLALVVVDEQHRFGVQQRRALLDRDPAPHLLSMTATPIPRSLALTIYGDLDLSVLNQLPKGRKPITTKLVFAKELPGLWQTVEAELHKGRQAYVVCPLIDPSDKLGARSVTDVAAMLKFGPGIRKGILHGKLKPDEKAAVIDGFREGKIDLLVSTTVVEVGVDVPNATIMVIMNAERFGLSQLHQLRGRVGRSDLTSTCYLIPESWSPNAKERLMAMTRTNDGFELAELDLKLRGAGNVFGSAQSGFPDFKLATPADVPLMKTARDFSARILESDPDLEAHPLLRQKVKEAVERVHLE